MTKELYNIKFNSDLVRAKLKDVKNKSLIEDYFNLIESILKYLIESSNNILSCEDKEYQMIFYFKMVDEIKKNILGDFDSI